MSRIVKVKAPVNSLESAEIQINAGADEIYLGMFSPDWFSNLSFSHRGKANLSSDKNGCINETEELKKIVDYAHSRGVTVSYTANLFNLPDTGIDENNNKTLVEGYLDYVGMGIENGVDSVIVATLSEIIHIRKKYKDIPIVASCLFMISNEYYYKLLRSLGVTSFFLPHDTNLSEMEKFCKLAQQETEKIEIGLFAHLSCAMLSGGCHWYHKFGEEIDIGYPCRNKYLITAEGNEPCEYPIFDLNTDCSLCQLSKMIHAGINSIKIVGRASSPKFTERITKTYCKAVDTVLADGDLGDMRTELVNEESWWKVMYCSKKACKYSETGKYSKYMIG